MKKIKCLNTISLILSLSLFITSCGIYGEKKQDENDVITLRVSNWEEYIDEDVIHNFEDYYLNKTGKTVKIEYSTFGTNEDLYHRLSIGDCFDIVCPSEYMIMKLMEDDMLLPFPSSFFDKDDPENFYINNVSPYIDERLKGLTFSDKSIRDYTAGYMWGTLGFIYNPKYVSKEAVSDWDFLLNKDYKRMITTKDSVRDCYFAALGIIKKDKVLSDSFLSSPSYHENLSLELNDTSEGTVLLAEDVLTKIKENVYAFETDSGKADLVTGKVVSNLQWSGDAVYSMEEALSSDVTLYYSVPKSSTNLWFDGWVLLKDGGFDDEKLNASLSFINFISRPENAILNMDYIGYTSVISGKKEGLIEGYIRDSYEEENEDNSYDISYFFGEKDGSVLINAGDDLIKGMLFARYPTKDVIDRSVVMSYFPPEDNKRVSRMWINIRCADFFK